MYIYLKGDMMHFLKRTMAFVLTFALCAETLLGGGVASAVALTPDSEGLPQQTEQLLAEDNAASAAAAGVVQSTPVAAAVDGASVNSNVNSSSTLDATIDVFWASVDDEGDDIFDAADNRVWTQDASQYKSYAATTKVRVLRNGADVAELEVKGEADAVVHEASIGGDTFTWQEVTPWCVQVSGLPECDANDVKYSYLFLEELASGFVSKNVERSADAESSNLYTCFYNARGNAEDEGTVVPVSVRWIDDGDAASRMPVKVGLYAKEAITVDGRTLYDKDAYIAGTDLNEGNSWYNEMNVSVSGLDAANDFYIAELSTFSDGDEAQGCYKVISRNEAVRNFENPEYAALLRNWPETDLAPRMVSTDSSQGFAYRVTYENNDALGSHEVVNQRIGFTEVVINQIWLDEGANKSARPKSTFTLASSGSGIEFVYDAGGVIYARVSGKDYTLYKKDTSGSLTSLTLSNESSDVTVSTAGDSLTISSDAFGDSCAFSIVNLPEYNAQGAAVNWMAEQNWVGEHGDYQMSGPTKQTSVSSWHQEDQLTLSLESKRVGVKSVTYHTKWFDHYVKDELNQRPGAGLELYRLVNEYDVDGDAVGSSSLEAVPAVEYDARCAWVASDPADCAANDSVGNFTQYITLANLPKYDAQGRVYIYYASVNLNESQGGQGTLSYRYDKSVSQDNYIVDPGSWSSANEEIARSASDANVSESVVAYREDSTFNYRICGEATLTGKLYWVDKNDAFNTRPVSVSLKLVRAHQDGSSDGALVGGEVNLQTTDSSAPNYLIWTAQPLDGGDAWTYEIRNLEKWDSDGRQWMYRVSESSVDSQYEIKPGTDNGGSCSSIESEFPDITNTLKDLPTLAKTDVSGEINWNDYGSGLANGLNPATCGIKLKLFRSIANSSEELVVDGSVGALPDSVLSWSKNSNNTWTYSFKNLPEYDLNACEYTYRVEEAGSEIPGWHFAGYGNDGTIIYVADNAGNPDNPNDPGNPGIPGDGAGDSDNPGSSGNASGNADNSDKLETVLPAGTSDKSAGSESAVAKQATAPKTGDSLPVCMFIIFSLVAFVLSFSYLIARCLRKSDW